ncbi:MAG: VIT and VWA domain-containing protein [Chloroflexota bacterium]|nr:VIT and VWA domain-containing protein [Dehalococcoidia bacterium]MDW8255050.1 VIT and VWA domain-containing protein [Chloroflexota bacterium]
MFRTARFDNSPAAPVATLEIAGEAGRFIPLRRTDLTGCVVGPFADLVLTHVYRFDRSQHAGVVEALYRFPLPGDAAVTGVTVRFGTVTIVATLAEREASERAYGKAVAEGRQAALLTRESPDVFTLRVAGIPPDENVAVTTRYVQLARDEGDAWTLRVPLTIAPRYSRGDETGSRPAAGQPLALVRDPGHRFALDVRFAGAPEVTSPTHRLALTAEADGLRVRLAEGEALPDRDCVLRWPASGRGLALFEQPAGGRRYLLALATVPGGVAGAVERAREVILLVDHSGSMEGPKWAAADWAVERFLTQLSEEPGERPTFALGVFHSTTRWFASVPQPATAENVRAAVAFLKAARDGGGTELGVALEQALRLPRSSGRAGHVIVVTDAEVTDAARILRLADEEAQRPDRRRISVLCIDAAPNSFLAGELADRGGGIARFLTSDPAAEDIATALDEMLAFWSGPVLGGLRLALNRPLVELAAGGTARGAEWCEIDLGDLRPGRASVVLARAEDGAPLRARLVGPTGVLAETEAVPAPIALAPFFGARRVATLEYLVGASLAPDDLRAFLARLGYDPSLAAGARTVYPENRRAAAERALKGLLVREALAAGLASSETAFVAVRQEAGQLVETRVVVANALPAGWSDRFLSSRGSMTLLALAQPSSPGELQLMRAVEAFPSIAETAGAPSAPRSAVLFRGSVPADLVLFDSSRGRGALPPRAVLSRLVARSDARPSGDVWLLIFIGDRSVPRARVRLADLLRQEARPLHLAVSPDDDVAVVLVDPHGELVGRFLELEVGW